MQTTLELKIKEVQKPQKKKYFFRVNFLSLYKTFKLKVVVHFIITVLFTFLSVFVSKTIENLVNNRDKHEEVQNDYSSLISHSKSCTDSSHSHRLHKFDFDKKEKHLSKEKESLYYSSLFPSETLKRIILKHSFKKQHFVITLIFLISLSSLFKYLKLLIENKLELECSSYLKNKLLTKFRSLEFEKKDDLKDEVKLLSEVEVNIVASSWEHLYNHFFSSAISIILQIYFSLDSLRQMSAFYLLTFFSWILFANLTYAFILNILISKQAKFKDHLSKDISLIDKEISKSLLIESMGLESSYEFYQRKITRNNDYLRTSIAKISSFNLALSFFLFEIYPFFVVYFSPYPFSSELLFTLFLFWNISHEVSEILSCFMEYSNYSSSCSRLNNFFLLPEKNENLDKEILNPLEIDEIFFSDVDFKYNKNDSLVLEKYNISFSGSKINNLIGKNGTGKSTIIYLLLGMLKPLSGNVFIKLTNGEILDLNRDINLKNWKEDIISYCSHDNLIEEGSTGERQIKNIENSLTKKESAKIFIFDEASNALDKEKQKLLLSKVSDLIKKGKIVIFVKH